MGCCISKCIHNKPSHEDQHQFNDVHNNLVISQTSPTSSIIVPHQYSSKNISPSPHSPTSSTSTITCTTTSNTTISSSTSSLSCSSSSTFTSKDKSFSNDFLWSCYKDNPHIIHINHATSTTTLPLVPIKPKKHQPRNIKPSSPKPSFAPKNLLSPSQNVVVGYSSMPQKRVRSNSPVNLTRQKSFRKHYTNSTTCLTPDVKDFDRSKNIGESHIIVGQLSQKEAERSNIPSRMLGSPSPSRKSNINGDKYCGSAKNSVSKSMINAPKVNAAHSSHCVLSSLRKESVKAANPNNSSRRFHNGLKHREIFIANKLGSDETVGSNHNMDSIMEDINNPLISLDCFIFL